MTVPYRRLLLRAYTGLGIAVATCCTIGAWRYWRQT